MKLDRYPALTVKPRNALCAWVGIGTLAMLTGCALPDKPLPTTLYDFGAVPLQQAGATTATLAAVTLLDVESSAALDSTALLYRLDYADARQPHRYAQARWSMTPAQLLQQRLRERLAQQRTVLKAGPVMLASAWTLRVELEEFNQWFDTPQHSEGRLRLRATVTQAAPSGDKLLGQRSFALQRAAPTADAPGGVRALSAASDAAIAELAQWLAQLER